MESTGVVVNEKIPNKEEFPVAETIIPHMRTRENKIFIFSITPIKLFFKSPLMP